LTLISGCVSLRRTTPRPGTGEYTTINTLMGILLFALGMAGIVIGFQESRRPANQAARLVLGRFTRGTLCLLAGGAIALALGLMLLIE